MGADHVTPGNVVGRLAPSAVMRPPAGGGVDVPATSQRLIADIARDPWGQLSPSVYETARLVTLAPWLTGHARRVAFLLEGQRGDGSWAAPEGYALVPTLSAAEALLSTLYGRAHGDSLGGGDLSRERLVGAADRALSRVFRWLRKPTQLSIPDTPAVEIIVPALVAAVNQHLDRLSGSPLPGLQAWRDRGPLDLPATLDGRTLSAIRARLDAGLPVAAKLMHSLEVADGGARRAPGVRPVSPGTVGASPAATAAWLGNHIPPPGEPAVGYLEAVVTRYGGPVPSVVPITVFERAWVLNTLATAGLDLTVPPQLSGSLQTALGETGTPGGAGLPPDADTTSVALLTLARLGLPQPLDCLWTFEADSHFVTWHGERTASTTTNAHVLDAIAHHLASRADPPIRATRAGAKVGRWLCDQQRDDGTWVDKWHASPYYATSCCALALHRFAGPGSTAAIRRSVDWVLDTQRPDGSWGRWAGTVEETAYAMHTLLLTTPPNPRRDRAAARGYTYLLNSADHPDRPPLWHDKDLYTPVAVIQAAVLAAMHLVHRDPAVMAQAA